MSQYIRSNTHTKINSKGEGSLYPSFTLAVFLFVIAIQFKERDGVKTTGASGDYDSVESE